jgi:hypothetical protein
MTNGGTWTRTVITNANEQKIRTQCYVNEQWRNVVIERFVIYSISIQFKGIIVFIKLYTKINIFRAYIIVLFYAILQR